MIPTIEYVYTVVSFSSDSDNVFYARNLNISRVSRLPSNSQFLYA